MWQPIECALEQKRRARKQRAPPVLVAFGDYDVVRRLSNSPASMAGRWSMAGTLPRGLAVQLAAE